MHQKVDKARDQTPKRKVMHKKIDRIRDQSETRIFYKNAKDNLRYQRKLYETFGTDTGFDVVCSSCLQYKSEQYCKAITRLSEDRQKKFIIKYCAILKYRSNDQYVCNLCLKDIKKDKMPKRSHMNTFKFANFPKYLIKKLKVIFLG